MDALSATLAQNFPKFDVASVTARRKQPCYLRGKAKVAVKAEDLKLTHQVLDEIPLWDTFAWNNLIQTHLTNGDTESVMFIFSQMLLRGVRPDKHTLPRVLTASRRARNLEFGKQVHAHAFKLGLFADQYVVTSLIEMYGRLDNLDTAKCLFDTSPKRNFVSWNIIARLYLMADKPKLAIDLFYQMVRLGSKIDSVALVTATSACGILNSLQEGKKVHEIANKFGFGDDILVCNSLMKMYIDCGSIGDAREIFDMMSFKDLISWTELIRGYVKNGGFNEGLKLFRKMVKDGMKPDALSMSSILPACARMAAHKQGKEIHGYLLRNRIDMNVTLHNAIMDMYVKSGYIEYASKVFAQMKFKDVISWTIMIMGYSLHGQGDLGVELFREMEKDTTVNIDEFTYAVVLHACGTARMVEKGKFYFNRVKRPKVTHYAMMVRLLAHAGHLGEAKSFIEEHQIGRHEEILRALLDGCRIHQQDRFGKQVAEQLSELDSLNAEIYVLLSNWHAHFGKWDMVQGLKETIGDMGLRPKKAYSWIEFRNKVHVFGTGDVSHPRSEEIYWKLKHSIEKMKHEGRHMSSRFSLHDVDEERECIQIGHSEMLAISFGLISKQAGATIRVTKNQRVCRNCHDYAKALSEMTGREIILKDPNCFHHFKNGFCSCGDFW